MRTNSKAKRQTKSRATSSSPRRSSSDLRETVESFASPISSSLTTVMDTVLATTGAGQELSTTLSNFARSIDDLTQGDAKETIAQVQNVIEHATLTYEHGRETVALAKEALTSVRGTAKSVFTHVKENPQPFIAAAVPAAVGLFMLYRRTQARSGAVIPTRRSNSSREISTN